MEILFINIFIILTQTVLSLCGASNKRRTLILLNIYAIAYMYVSKFETLKSLADSFGLFIILMFLRTLKLIDIEATCVEAIV